MKLQFDANQDYQIQAIDSITGIFEVQPLEKSDLSFHIDEQDKLKLISGVGNNLILSEEQIIKNCKR
jgi:type III restriction enzyme